MKRLFLTISVGILVALVISSIIASQVIRLSFNKVMRERMEVGSRGLAMLAEEHLNSLPTEALPQGVERLQDVLPEPLVLVAGNDDSIPQAVRSQLERHQYVTHSVERFKKFYIRVHKGRYVAVLGPIPRVIPPPPFPLVLLVLGIILPIVGCVAYILTYPVVRRLRILEEAVARIGKGDVDARAKITSSDVIGDLARQFNQMADRIQSLLENQRNLLQAVSHELRTPISRIRFILQMLSEADDKSELNKRIRELEIEWQELSDLVDELLLFVRFDGKSKPPRKRKIAVQDMLNDVIERHGDIRPEIRVDVQQVETAESVEVFAHESHFRLAIQNLLSNAIRHASDKVVIAYAHTEEGVRIEIADDGPGIPPGERDKVFRPFIRLDESRGRDSGGAGLGLAIVQRIMESHEGSVSLVGNSSHGVRFITIRPDSTS